MSDLEESNLSKSGAFINGTWKSGGNTFSVFNPATGELIEDVYDATEEDTQEAISAAKAALPAWASLTAKERSQILRRWYELILEHADILAAILTTEQGKPLVEAKAEIIYGANFVEWFAEEAKRAYGDVIPAHGKDKRLMVIKQPVGVVAAITPWNFPNAMLTRKIAPALAAGCTVIAKPAEDTPLSALALAALAEMADVPAGVLNILPTSDSPAIGKILCESPDIAKLSFTGSTEVGKILMEQSAGTLKKLSLELGGNAPFIVFEDADIDAAIQGLLVAKFRNAGQTCVSANRIYVHESILESFTAKLHEEVMKLKVGDGIVSGMKIGPLINQAGMMKVMGLVDDAINHGADMPDGEGMECDDLFMYPLVLTNMNDEMKMASEEIFGPVAPIYSFKAEEEVIERANNSAYGLAAYFYTQNAARIFRVSEKLEYGMIGINEGLISTELAPFGGVKASGFGREGSKYGLEEYLSLKYLCVGGIRP